MATLTLRQTNPASGTNKGAPLTNAEVDANFNSLDTAKFEKSGGTLTGVLIGHTDVGNIIPFYFDNQAAFPSAVTYHGAIAHSHADGKMFQAHGGSWMALANETGNVATATAWATGRTITLTGDVTGVSSAFNGTGNLSFATTIAANSVALGTDTTGNYVASLVAGTGVTLTNNSGESATPTVAIGQAVGTASDVTFGNINVGSATGATTGQIKASGDIIAFSSSDERLKTNVQVIPDALAKVLALRGVTFNWNEAANAMGLEGKDTGVIAQEVAAVLPEVVATREDGHMAVKYDKMIGLLIEAIKDLNGRLDNCNCTK